MQRIAVESSDIISIGYDSKSRLLEIEFQGGRIYRYIDVEPSVHKHFMQADSFGQYFNSFINNRYKYEKAEQDTKTRPNSVAFVTSNHRKARDLKLACEPYGIEVEQLDLPVDEIQSHDSMDVAVKKAKHAYALARRPVVTLDAFWNILALRGFPGGFMSYVMNWLKPEEFLKLMEDKKDRTVIGTKTLVYYDGKRHKAFVREVHGVMADESRGKGHFPVDRIIIVDGQTKTIAEVEDEHGHSSIHPVGDELYTPFAKWLHLKQLKK